MTSVGIEGGAALTEDRELFKPIPQSTANKKSYTKHREQISGDPEVLSYL